MTPSPWDTNDEDYDDEDRHEDVERAVRVFLAQLAAPRSPDDAVRALVLLRVRLHTCGLEGAEVDAAVGRAADLARERGLL